MLKIQWCLLNRKDLECRKKFQTTWVPKYSGRAVFAGSKAGTCKPGDEVVGDPVNRSFIFHLFMSIRNWNITSSTVAANMGHVLARQSCKHASNA